MTREKNFGIIIIEVEKDIFPKNKKEIKTMDKQNADTALFEEKNDYIKMDYSLDNVEERIKKVEEIIANTPPEKLTPQYLDKMAQYLIDLTLTKEEKKTKKIITSNRRITINKREMSFEGLASKLESGEDGIYSMIANDKNILFNPKRGITKEDIETVPGLKELIAAIEEVQAEFAVATGRRKYQLKRQIIEMQQDQYELKKSYKQPIYLMNITKSASRLNLDEKIIYDTEKNSVISTSMINLYNPDHISLLLCNYSNLKEECWDKFDSDIKWLISDLENLIDNVLREGYPIWYKILIYKIDKKTNAEIQQLIFEEFETLHTVEYISTIWRKKIPKLLAEKAEEKWLVWHFTVEEKGKWKKCSKCGQIKLANPRFFSKNNTSKDGFYSQCKECRSNNYKKKKG